MGRINLQTFLTDKVFISCSIYLCYCRSEQYHRSDIIFLHYWANIVISRQYCDKGRHPKKTVLFRTLSKTVGGWGSRVLNFLVKIHIQLFVLQTSSNVLKHISHKVRRSYLAISGCFDAPKISYCSSLTILDQQMSLYLKKKYIYVPNSLKRRLNTHFFPYFWSPKP